MIYGCYFDIIQLFLAHSINMVHSCIAMLKVQTMLSKLSGKILILIKNYNKTFFLNYFKIILFKQPPKPNLK